MLVLKELSILSNKISLSLLPQGKLLINTINAHSYNTALKDPIFAEALSNGDVLLPDGISIVKACHWLKAKSQPQERIAGWDLFHFEMTQLNKKSGKVLWQTSLLTEYPSVIGSIVNDKPSISEVLKIALSIIETST